VPEYLGVESDEPGLIYSNSHMSIKELLDKHPVDIIIDFSSNTAIYNYGELASEREIKIISAVSHYKKEEMSFLKKLSKKTTVFWSPNITFGVNYLLFVSKFLKKMAPWADIEIVEEHFKDKAEVSGTAVKIAKALNIRKSKINSVRAGGIVGRHEIIFGFPYQTVRLIHESVSREAFGNGVIFVSQNILNIKKGLYNFEDLLLPYFGKNLSSN
jgi:4-hydroxy-tetrahydrodipicolinate reductase